MESCDHYRLNCLYVANCCRKPVSCKQCHDLQSDHEMIQKDTRAVICLQCSHRQDIGSRSCHCCGALFGTYYCSICNTLHNTLGPKFHCNMCNACVSGEARATFHCERCDICIPIKMRGGKVCIPGSGLDDCPVCYEKIKAMLWISTPCGHLMHKYCFIKLLKSRHFHCPLCRGAIINSDLSNISPF